VRLWVSDDARARAITQTLTAALLVAGLAATGHKIPDDNFPEAGGLGVSPEEFIAKIEPRELWDLTGSTDPPQTPASGTEGRPGGGSAPLESGT
jgi:hypothetical protein